MSRLRKPSPALVVAIVALVAALGGVAIAAPLNPDGTVHLCYSQSSLDDPNNGSSAVYVVNAGHACDGDYPDTLVMNQTGPRGRTGMVGPRGPQGYPGHPGPAGPATGGLGGKVTHQALGGLTKVGKGTTATGRKLAHDRNQLLALIRRHGQIPPDVLARQQAQLMQVLSQLTHQVQDLNDVSRKVVRKLGG